ncbi:zinc finger (C3HC4-type RING finger) family protein [Artemisia annua]|uniref:Zinc finger (C3HC4-type RING finger) family protein n=1 Tax=Artemisia annua TaxID=35608 RepID=A0A2U1PUS3_ARTAN|nr:zinc finger (C3HC4-type RING finger) family protein [Artemisia annua]
MPLLSVEDQSRNNQFVDIEQVREKLATRYTEDVTKQFKVYNDDEPLACLTPKARFNPIPESDENCEDEEDDVISEFKGFCVNDDNFKNIEVRLLPEAAVIAASRRNETYAVVMKVKAPPARENSRHRPPVDLVTVVDVSGKMSAEKLHVIKKAMRSIVSSLTSSDRLSIVAFSSYSKRLLPLRRMTITGRRSARRIVEAMAVLEGSSNAKDAVKKAVKVLEDRRERNTFGTIILLSEVMLNESASLSSRRVSHARVDVPVHSLTLSVTEDHVLVKFINNLLHVPVQDLRLNLGVLEPAVIAAVYSRTPHPIVLGSSTVHIGNLSTDEEKELLIELKVPSVRAHTVLSVRCSFRESFSQEIIYGNQQSLLVPKPSTVRSSSPTIQRLRNLFISTRALAESRRLSERNDTVGAYHMLVSARALIQQGSSAPDEFMFGLEAELSEMKRRRKVQAQVAPVYTDEKGEPLTPTSAWRVADKLAKVAMMRKSVNRVSDLHGFEDARF